MGDEVPSTKYKIQGWMQTAAPLVLDVRVVTGAGGGPDKTILRTARHLDAQRYRMAAAYLHPQGDGGIGLLREQARQQGCPFYEIGEAGALDPRSVRALLQLCRKLRVAVWHGHDYKANALGLLLRRFWPMKLVTTVHGWTWETRRTRLYYHMDNFCLPRYDQIITVNSKLRDHCLTRGIAPEKVTMIANGIEPEEYRREQEAATVRRELGVPAGALVVGVVGRFSPEKGVDRAIDVLADLRGQHQELELHLVGDGPECARLQKLARKLKVEAAVRFWGWQQRSQRFYEMMDVLLLPSHTEGLPNVVLEAMAMGVAVAGTDVGGVREVLDDGRCGVVLTGEAPTWGRQIAPLLVSAPRRAELARRARQRVEEHYSFRGRIEKLMRIYDRVLSIAGDGAAVVRRAA